MRRQQAESVRSLAHWRLNDMSVTVTPHVAHHLERYVTVQDLAALLQVHPRTIRRMSRRGDFPAPIRVGTMLRWREGEVTKYLDAQAHRQA